PETYAEVRARWLAQASRNGASAVILSHAAMFFEDEEPRLAEDLFLRARAFDPQGYALTASGSAVAWSQRLSRFYARALGRPVDPDGRSLAAADVDPYVRGLGERLLASADATMLDEVGRELLRTSRADAARTALARRLLERAIAL